MQLKQNNIFQVIFHRNSILLMSIVLGFLFHDFAHVIKPYNILLLAIVMTASTSGFALKTMLPLSKSMKTMAQSLGLSYFVFGGITLLLSWFFIDDRMIFLGMVAIVASPPGVAVIPFTHILKGDMGYTMAGVIGCYLASIILMPLIFSFFVSGLDIDLSVVIKVMIYVLLIPLIISRFLRNDRVYPIVEKVRGRVVDIGFALIIFTVVGINSRVFTDQFELVVRVIIILFITIFVMGLTHYFVGRKQVSCLPKHISRNLILVIKSTGFTASIAVAVFGEKAAVPSAILAVFTLIYLMLMSVIVDQKK